MDPVWLGVAGTVGVQIVVAVYVIGRYSAKFERIEKWIENDADPMLNDHAERITHLEARGSIGPNRR